MPNQSVPETTQSPREPVLETVLKILDVSLYVLETHRSNTSNGDDGIKKIENDLKGIKSSIFEYEQKKAEEMKKRFRGK